MKALTLKEIIVAADHAYSPNETDLLLQYLGEDGAVLAPALAEKVPQPDTLALFIVREIADVIQGEEDPKMQREQAAHAVGNAIWQLARVQEALQKPPIA